MEKRTTKTHPEFDFVAAQMAYAKVKEELCGEQITSPYDLYSVERLPKGVAPYSLSECY